MGRRIPVTLGIRLIILDRCVKAFALILGGVVLLVSAQTGALAQFASRLQTEINVSPGSHLWLRVTDYVVQHISALGARTEDALAGAALAYAALEIVEAIGLVKRRRWAEYLVLLATCAFIPLEVDELIKHPTPLKALTLLINVAIAVYLVVRKQLFLERPPPAGARPDSVTA